MGNAEGTGGWLVSTTTRAIAVFTDARDADSYAASMRGEAGSIAVSLCAHGPADFEAFTEAFKEGNEAIVEAEEARADAAKAESEADALREQLEEKSGELREALNRIAAAVENLT